LRGGDAAVKEGVVVDSIKGRGPVLLVVVLLTTVGVIYAPGKLGSGGSTGATASGSAGAATKDVLPLLASDDERDVLTPLRSYLGVTALPGDEQGLADALGGDELDVVIATIPDPDDSRFRYQFDMSVDAFQRGIESQGFILDHFRLPWINPETRKGKGEMTLLYERATKFADPGPLWQRQPGSILYRKPVRPWSGKGPRTKLILLLLVGESPTIGLQKGAFRTSLDLAVRLGKARSHDRPAAVRVLGPSFSGTADSMTTILRERRVLLNSRKIDVWICSGSATSVDKTDFQRRSGLDQVRYTATVLPDELVSAEMLRFLRDPGGHAPEGSMPNGRIALLTESNTAYGSSNATHPGDEVISIPFPLQISQVRSLADHDSSKDGRSAGALATGGKLPIPLDESLPTVDTVPVYYRDMTAPTDYLVLSNILGTIARENVRYVGIWATDTRDIIFLTRLIRNFSPDVQFFLQGSDLRLTHPDFSNDFRGTIVASSYPLEARNQLWSYPFGGDRRRLLFAHETDVGSYNAMIFLLNGDPKGTDELELDSRKAADLVSYGRPFDVTSDRWRPAVWINIVGQNNLWPLRAIPPRGKASESVEGLVPAVVRHPGSPTPKIPGMMAHNLPSAWLGLVLMLSTVTFGAALVYLDVARGTFGGLVSRTPPFRGLTRLIDARRDSSAESVLFFSHLLLAALVVPLCYATKTLGLALPSNGVPEGTFWSRPLAYGRWVSRGMAASPPVNLASLFVVLTALFAVVVALLLGTWRLQRQAGRMADGSRSSWHKLSVSRIVSWAIAALIVVVVIDRVSRIATPIHPDNYLAIERAVVVNNGVSQMVPALILGTAFASWVVLHLKRLELLRGLCPPSPFVPLPGVPSLSKIDMTTRALRRLISKPWRERTYLVVSGLGMLAMALVLFSTFFRFIPTPEGKRFDVSFQLAFGTFLLILVLAFARFVMLWLRTSALFRRLSMLPMAGAFDRLPTKVALLFGRFLQANRLTVDDLAIPQQQVNLLRRGFTPAVRQSLRSDYHVSEAQLDAFAAAAASCVSPADVGGLRSVAASVLPIVTAWWPSHTIDEAFGGDTVDIDKAAEAVSNGTAPAANVWLGQAEDFLAIEAVFHASQFAPHLRDLTTFLTIGPLLLLISATWYPFQPQRLLAIVVWAAILASAAATVFVFFQVDRDEFVSRVSRTRAHNVTFDRAFLSNLMTYLVPIIGLGLSEFPGISYWLTSMLEPLGRVIR
jgi:hypothetical protein